jgi:hypothetical protein
MDTLDDQQTSPAPPLDNHTAPTQEAAITTTNSSMTTPHETAIATTPAAAETFTRPATIVNTPKPGQPWERSALKAQLDGKKKQQEVVQRKPSK